MQLSSLQTWSAAILAWQPNRAWQRVMISLAWSALVTAFLLGENLQAEWGIIDDHDIAAFLGPTGSLSAADLWDLLANHAEVGAPSRNFGRYRPAYYTLRLTECFLWGNNPHLWYAARLVYATLALALFWDLLGRWLGSLTGSLALLVLLTYPFWKDIWCRLGPAEIYGTLGMALYLTGAAAVWRYSRSELSVSDLFRTLAWTTLVLGAFMAFGSKENFLPLVPFTWILAGWLAWQRRLGWIGLAGTLFLSCAGLGIAMVVALSLRQIGKDIHAQEVDPFQRLNLLRDMLRMIRHRPESKIVLAGAVAALTLIWLAWRSGRLRQMRPTLSRTGLGLLAGGLVLASQFLFYNGSWPRNNRYDFPGLLALPLMAIILAWLVLTMIEQLGWRCQTILRLGFAGLLTVIVAGRGYAPLRQAAHGNVVRTTQFCQKLENIVPCLQEDASRPILFVSHHAQDYEPLLSLRRFLRARHVSNPLFLRLDGYGSDEATAPRYRSLAKVLHDYSLSGDAGEAARRGSRLPEECFLPLTRLSDDHPAIEIDFLPGLELRLRQSN